MTREDIIRMAREAGLDGYGTPLPAIERFAALVAAQEREACAEICYALGSDSLNDEMDYRAFLAFREAEEKIRSRGEVKP